MSYSFPEVEALRTEQMVDILAVFRGPHDREVVPLYRPKPGVAVDPEVRGGYPVIAARVGLLAPGDRLSSEWELAQQYQTSRPTVRRAVAVLTAEGLVITEQGRGAFVRPQPHVRLVVTGANYRRHRSAGLPGFNAPVVLRRRLFLMEDQPVSLCDSYYPADMAVGTAIAERRLVGGGALAVIEDPAGPIRRMAARSVDELTSRMPTRAEIDQLRLSLGMPIVRVLRTIYDTQGAPLEVQDSVAAADRHEFRYEVDMR
ncbi:MAG: GntR family transcriptional regulator [Pseudonocardiaceae bacterium]